MGLEVSPVQNELLGNACTFPDLHKAVITNNPKLLLSCVRCTEDVNQKDENSFAPLHLAVSLRKLGLVEFLLKECHADVNVRTQSGLTPLHVAALGPEKLDILRMLIQHGSDVNSTDCNGCTALHLAVRSQSCKFVIVLLEEGCDHTILDKKGRSAKDIAIEYKYLEVIEILNEHEEGLSPREDTSPTMIHRAVVRAKHDLHTSLFRRSSSLVSCASSLKTIIENENVAYYPERTFHDSESVSIDSESDCSSPDFADTVSLESVFSQQNASLDSFSNKKQPDAFRKRFGQVSNPSLNSFNSSDSVCKLASTFNSRLANGIQTNGYNRPAVNSRKIPVHRTRSLEVAQLPSVKSKLLSAINDTVIRSEINGHTKGVDEGLPTNVRAENNTSTNGQKSPNLHIDKYLDRSDNVYCFDVNENIQTPRLRKIASSSFSLGNMKKQNDVECDEDILALLHPSEHFQLGNDITIATL